MFTFLGAFIFKRLAIAQQNDLKIPDNDEKNKNMEYVNLNVLWIKMPLNFQKEKRERETYLERKLPGAI
ncbi:MAG: hypothetical protein HYV28_09470 [Ignavibacteriales bacterium]|nr:hypothetical protein [Ignavibacteriales bacterium]